MHAVAFLLAAGVAGAGSPPVSGGFDHVVVTARGPRTPAPAFGLDTGKGLLVAPAPKVAPARPGPQCAVRVVPADPEVDRGIHRPAPDVVDPAMAVSGRCAP